MASSDWELFADLFLSAGADCLLPISISLLGDPSGCSRCLGPVVGHGALDSGPDESTIVECVFAAPGDLAVHRVAADQCSLVDLRQSGTGPADGRLFSATSTVAGVCGRIRIAARPIIQGNVPVRNQF